MKTASLLPVVVLAVAVPVAAADDQGFPPATGSSPAQDFSPRKEFELSPDGRRTMGRFASNLGRNLVGVFGRESLRPLAFGVALAGTGALFDGPTERFFEERARAPQLGRIGQTVGGASVVSRASLLLFAAGRGSRDARFRAATYDVMQATLVTHAYTTALKLAVGRTRPDGSDDLSFPSGHTSNAFAWATVARHHYGGRVGALAYGAAGLIGLSRMEKDVHHLSDVLAGATLGVLVGRTVVREDGEPLAQPRFGLVPMSDPTGRGIGMGVSLSF